ncbi:MAG: zinc-dependent metalloprotease [Actinobacteria bacterium]|nr:zinc-dependent metalloprotease [Actinomycetota bacterium]
MGDPPQPGDGEPDDERPGFPFGPAGFGAAGPFGRGGFDLSHLDMAQMMRMLQSEGPVNWEIASQVATWVATNGEPEHALPPDAREQFEELANAARAHVVSETGLTTAFQAPVQTLDRAGWAALHVKALRAVLESLAGNLEAAMAAAQAAEGPIEDVTPEPGQPDLGALLGLPPGTDPFGRLLTTLAPVLLGVQSGSMIGYLAQHALGRYDLPLPADDAPSLAFVVPNLDAFEQEWSLPRTDLRFYVAVHETLHAAQRLVPWVQQRLVKLAIEYVGAYELDPTAFENRFGDIDPTDPESLASIASQPEALLGAMQSDRQRDVLRRLQTFTSVLEGYADVVLDRIGERLIPSYGQIHEAMKRHRLVRGEADRFIEGLLGLRLEREHYERGEAFCRGVIERAGPEGLNRLWESEEMVPTPAELEAPGLWLARIDL